MLLFPHVGHLQVSITRPISYLYKSDSGIDKYEEEIVPDDEKVIVKKIIMQNGCLVLHDDWCMYMVNNNMG